VASSPFFIVLSATLKACAGHRWWARMDRAQAVLALRPLLF